jgi:hypothetical protein
MKGTVLRSSTTLDEFARLDEVFIVVRRGRALRFAGAK